MPKTSDKWTLAALIDFETALAGWNGKGASRVASGTGRAEGMRMWLEKSGSSGLGGRWVASLGLTGVLLALVFAILGALTAWGTFDREVDGVHVIWFLAVALVLPWVFLLLGLVAWLLRGRVIASGVVGWAVERLSVRLAGRKAKVGDRAGEIER